MGQCYSRAVRQGNSVHKSKRLRLQCWGCASTAPNLWDKIYSCECGGRISRFGPFNAYIVSRADLRYVGKLMPGGVENCRLARYIFDLKEVGGTVVALFGNEFGDSILTLSCVSFLFLHHHQLNMSFSVDDLVSSLSNSHISQEASDIAMLQVNGFSAESSASRLTLNRRSSLRRSLVAPTLPLVVDHPEDWRTRATLLWHALGLPVS